MSDGPAAKPGVPPSVAQPTGPKNPIVSFLAQ